MKKILFPTVALTALSAAPAVQAQYAGDATNHLSVSYRLAFNLGVKFKHLGGFASPNDPGPATGGGLNRYYDNGYNLVDNNNNSYGDLSATRNWGYTSPGQVQAGRYIVLQSSSTAPLPSTPDRSCEPYHGFEIAYQSELVRYDTWRWGVEGAFNYMPVSVTDRATYSASVTRINDAFEVPADETGFRYIPSAPYSGSNAGGPLLGDTPNRTLTTIPNGATIAGSRSLDTDLYGFKLGPYLDFPLSERWRVTLSGGLAVVIVESRFSYREVVTLAGAGSSTQAGSGYGDDLLVGGYATGNIAYTVNAKWEVFANVQWQNVGKFTQRLDGPAAELDLSNNFFLGLGASRGF